MGTLLYGFSAISVEFPDRALWHLQIVITAKLRRREGFTLSWADSPDAGSGRTAIWLDASSTLIYRYWGSRVPGINKDWIDELMLSANSTGGLVFTPEPGTPATTAYAGATQVGERRGTIR